MPEERIDDAQYQKGFNEGYLISKHMPELGEQLSQVKTDNPRMEGFRDGRNEQVKEIERYPDWLKRDFSKPLQSKEKEDKSIDHDKD
jgi:hypothetical protein